MLKFEILARKLFSNLCQRQCCEAFVLVRIKSSLMKQNEVILENKTQKEKQTWTEKLSSKDCSVERRVNTARKTKSCKTANQQSLVNKIT